MGYQERENGRMCIHVLNFTSDAADPCSLPLAVRTQITDARLHAATAGDDLRNTLKSIVHDAGICFHKRCDPLN
jgi:hypothetical protein